MTLVSRDCFFRENYTEGLSWLRENTIFLFRHGSHAYGTNTPESDVDVKGVAIAPLKYQIGFLHNFEQADKGFATDTCIFELVKFMKLAAECNPNIIEALFVDDSDILYEHAIFAGLRRWRTAFLSKQAQHRFTGYAVAQLKRIETHRRWLLNPPKKEPFRRDFDLPDNTLLPKDQLAAAEDLVKKKLYSWDVELDELEPALRIAIRARFEEALSELVVHDRYDLAGRAIGLDTNMLEVMRRERQYSTARNEWRQFQEWQKKRSPQRHELEVKYGYDTKHGMHLVRLMRMCREILTTGRVNVRRPDAEELLNIRRGAWSYDRLIGWAKAEEEAMDAVAAASKLPKSPDREFLDKICRGAICEFLGISYERFTER
jgi:predicted nucleotidyltransferase